MTEKQTQLFPKLETNATAAPGIVGHIEKLSKPQQHVIDLMRAGWQLRYYPGVGILFPDSAVLEHERDREDVRMSTVKALERRGLITYNRKTAYYTLC